MLSWKSDLIILVSLFWWGSKVLSHTKCRTTRFYARTKHTNTSINLFHFFIIFFHHVSSSSLFMAIRKQRIFSYACNVVCLRTEVKIKYLLKKFFLFCFFNFLWKFFVFLFVKFYFLCILYLSMQLIFLHHFSSTTNFFFAKFVFLHLIYSTYVIFLSKFFFYF